MVTEESSGQRVDKFLGQLDFIASRSRAEHLITKNLVHVKQEPVRSSYKVKTGDQIEITLPQEEESKLESYDFKLDILFEDEDVIVVNKPVGLVVHPAAGHKNDTLVNALMAHTDDLAMKFGEDRPGIIHRLDKDTSGVLDRKSVV